MPTMMRKRDDERFHQFRGIRRTVVLFFFYEVQNTNIVSTRRLEMEKERGRGNERRQHASHETPQTRLKRKRRFDPTLRRGLSQSFTKPMHRSALLASTVKDSKSRA